MKMIQTILFFFALISYTSNAIDSDDFCVADLSFPDTPSGYPCKSENNVTADDFVFSGLNIAANTSTNSFKVAFTPVKVDKIPGLNGLGISVARIDLGFNGSVPMHTHPGVGEFIIVIQGQMTAGFITPTKVFMKTLNPGDVWVFPTGLLHFILNTGPGNAVAYSAYTSSNFATHLTDFLLFGNSLPTPTVQKTTHLDPPQIIKLKANFGGSG